MQRRTLASNTAAGFTVVELMVAVAVSLLLLSGVVAIFASSRSSYESTDQLSRIQESGRFAVDMIARNVRTAGFSGCSRQPPNISTTLNTETVLQWDFLGGPARGYESTGANTWEPVLDDSVTAPASDSDVLVLRGPRMGAEPLPLTAAMAAPDADMILPNVNTGIEASDIAMAYSCEGVAFFQVNSFSGGVLNHGVSAAVTDVPKPTPGNARASVDYTFRLGTEVVPVETVIYYVRASNGAGTTLPTGTTSLWRRVGLRAAEEVVEGIERMQVEYGIDTTGDRVIDTYAKANAVTDWQQVIAVRVALLVRSVQEYGTDRDSQGYKLLDVDVAAPGDRRLRQVFTATTSLRNRIRVD